MLHFVYVVKGGVGVLNTYIDKYGRRLFGLCRTLCTNPSDAEDLYQETWLKVYHKLDQYDDQYAFEGWLTRICVNTYKDQYRKRKLSLLFDRFDSQEKKDFVLENAKAEEQEDYSDLHEAVQKLPEKIRLTVLLFYFRELDTKETSRVLGIPEGTVKSRLSKARTLLKEMMKNEIEL